MDEKDIKSSLQELLNVAQAALFLDVSATSIRRWAKSRKLAGMKIGVRGDWRFTKEDLLKMLKGTMRKNNINNPIASSQGERE